MVTIGAVVAAAFAYWLVVRAPLAVRVSSTMGDWAQGAERLAMAPTTTREWSTDRFVYYEVDLTDTGWRAARALYRSMRTGARTGFAQLILRIRGAGTVGTVTSPEAVDGLFILWATPDLAVWRFGAGKVVVREARLRKDCDVLSARVALERAYPDSKYWPLPATPGEETLSLSATRVCFDRGTAINIFQPFHIARILVLREWLDDDPDLKDVLPDFHLP